MPRKLRKQREKKEKTPHWQFEYLRTGKIKTDSIFDELPEEDWPTDIEPTPWAALYFEIYEALSLWEKLKTDGINKDDFPYAVQKWGDAE